MSTVLRISGAPSLRGRERRREFFWISGAGEAACGKGEEDWEKLMILWSLSRASASGYEGKCEDRRVRIMPHARDRMEYT